MKRLRIGIISPISWRTPSRCYGPLETGTSYLTEELVRRGHKVTLFATGDSITKAKLASVCPQSLLADSKLRKDGEAYKYLHIAKAFERNAEFDIIQSMYDWYPLFFSKLVDIPLVTAIRGLPRENGKLIVPFIYRYYKDMPYISISYSFRKAAPFLNYVGNVYHGLPLELFPFSSDCDEYAVYLGRICKEKGVHDAIKIALKSGIKLKLAGLIAEEDKKFFEKEVKPRLGKQISYVGNLNLQEKVMLLQKASCLIHMAKWEEPFGWTLIEAMACGTPVIARGRGSIPEVIKHEETGFIVNRVDEAVRALRNISTIGRKKCRRRVENFFTVQHMASGYEHIYQKLIK